MEEEQLDNIKRFWKENGSKLLSGVALVAVVVGGWFYYQERQAHYYETAAVEYHKLLELMEKEGQDPKELAQVEQQAQLIQKEYAKSPYAAAGALLVAKQAVDHGNIPDAKAQLEWIILNSKENDLVQLAHARLARILLSEKNYEAALKEVENYKGNRYEAEFQEIRGDIFYSMQKTAEARAAYDAALKSMPDTPEKMLVQMKYDDLASPTDMLWSPESAAGKTEEKKP
jgi:predicted negative regulator of RcsB-dependent stress response